MWSFGREGYAKRTPALPESPPREGASTAKHSSGEGAPTLQAQGREPQRSPSCQGRKSPSSRTKRPPWGGERLKNSPVQQNFLQ